MVVVYRTCALADAAAAIFFTLRMCRLALISACFDMDSASCSAQDICAYAASALAHALSAKTSVEDIQESFHDQCDLILNVSSSISISI